MNTFVKDFSKDFSSFGVDKGGEEILSPEEYLELFQKYRDKIKNVELIPPKLGKKGFGKFKVTYKNRSFRFKNGR